MGMGNTLEHLSGCRKHFLWIAPTCGAPPNAEPSRGPPVECGAIAPPHARRGHAQKQAIPQLITSDVRPLIVRLLALTYYLYQSNTNVQAFQATTITLSLDVIAIPSHVGILTFDTV